VNLFSIESTMKIISKPKFIGGQPMKTYMANPDKIERKWYVVDAEGQTLGRLAAEVAKVLRGKNKPEFTPHIDTGDNVIVINAEKIKVTGKKLDQKVYYHHSDYVGGMKETTLREMMAKKPEQVIELAVKGMLPKRTFGKNNDQETSCICRSRTCSSGTETRSFNILVRGLKGGNKSGNS